MSLRGKIDKQKLVKMLPACFTVKREGKVLYGARALGEMKEEMQFEEEKKERAPTLPEKKKASKFNNLNEEANMKVSSNLNF